MILKADRRVSPTRSNFTTCQSNALEIISLGVITSQGGGVTTCNVDITIPLFLPYPPIPTRTRNEGVRPKLLSHDVFKKKTTS